MNEQERREKFLRDRGSFSRGERREKFLQREEIKVRIDWLKNNIATMTNTTNPGGRGLRNAWLEELRQKEILLLKLLKGEPISKEEIRERTSEIAVVTAAANGRLEKAATNYR